MTEPDDSATAKNAHVDEPSLAMAQSAAVIIWLSGPQGERAFVNEDSRPFAGLTLDQERTERWVQELHPEDRDGWLATYAHALRQREPFEMEYRLRRVDGQWRWMLERGVPLYEPGDNFAGFIGACMDITERREAEVKLHRSREELRLALAAGNMGTWVWDRNSGQVSRDTNLQALYGLQVQPSVGSYDEWVGLVHPEDRARVVEEVERSVSDGDTYEIEHRIIRPDGQVRWLERRGEAYRNEAGEVAGTRGLVIDITERKAAEAERDRLLAAEQDARQAAEVAARRLAHLQAVTAALAHAGTAEEVAEAIVVQGTQGLGATSGAVCLLVDDGNHLEVIRHVGYDPDSMVSFQVFPVDAELPASEAVRTGDIVLLRSLEERDARYPNLRGLFAGNVSLAAVPVSVDRSPAGAIALGWTTPQVFSAEDRRFLIALGQQGGQALERARLHQAAQRLAQRQSFLAEASRLLGSSLDYETTSAEVARLAVPTAADWCAIYLADGSRLRAVGSAPGDSDSAQAAEHLKESHGCFSEVQLLEVMASGRPLVVQRSEQDGRGDTADDAGFLALLDRVGTRSAMAVALRSANDTMGVLAVGMTGSGRRYLPGDLSYVEDLAARIASAISNGRSHQARTEIARTLQHSLLPPKVPLIPGLELAARYHPVGDHIEVGGDFYDVFAVGDDRWGVVIGDVSGKGVLAASLTALARYTVRTAARRETSASAVLRVLNSSILDHGVDERFCTIALAFVNHGGGDVGFTLSCAGHPLPLLVDREGAVRPVGRTGTAVGLFVDPTLVDDAAPLGPGELLVFYTDGVVEARSPSGKFAEGLVEATLATCAGASADEVADALERELLEFVGGRPRDDTAVLVVRRPSRTFHHKLSPSPRAVTEARHLLRSWLADELDARDDLADDVLLLVTELATNAARVASSAVHLHVFVDRDQVTIDVSDDGPGLGAELPAADAIPRLDSTVGRGLYIVRKLADQFVVQSGSRGTVIRCIKELAARSFGSSG